MQVVHAGTLAGKAAIAKLVTRGRIDRRVDRSVQKILHDVRRRGDAALRGYAMKFDGLEAKQSFAVSPRELEQALKWLRGNEPDFISAVETAAHNIRRFCEWQRPAPWTRSMCPGVRVGQMVRPLDSVGCYVPGGRYPLPSTLLMTVIPAQVAGVRRVVVVSPRPGMHTLATAALLRVKNLYRIGGAQAIAALAFGTKSLPAVDKIVGPGNSYVTAAKRLCGRPIDMLAGPTEALIVSHRGDARFIAADLVAQAEHDIETRVAFISTSARLATAVAEETQRLAAKNPTAKKALARNGCAIIATSRDQAMEFANAIASEHLTVDEEDVFRVRAAGSLFIGDYSTQPAGDYASGPNHVLPTGGLAHTRGGLSVNDFVKVITTQRVSRSGLRKIGPTVMRMAVAEGLRGHAAAVAARMQRKNA